MGNLVNLPLRNATAQSCSSSLLSLAHFSFSHCQPAISVPASAFSIVVRVRASAFSMRRPARLSTSVSVPFRYVHYPVLVLTLLQFLQAISEFMVERGHIHQSLCWHDAQGARFGKLTLVIYTDIVRCRFVAAAFIPSTQTRPQTGRSNP